MPRDAIELMTPNIAVVAARLRTKTTRCDEKPQTLLSLSSATSCSKPIHIMQEGKSLVEVAQQEPVSSTTSSPEPKEKVIPCFNSLSSSLLPISPVPLEVTPAVEEASARTEEGPEPQTTLVEKALRIIGQVQADTQMFYEWLSCAP